MDKFNFLEVAGREVLEGKALDGLDDKAREKLIAQGKLKSEKVKDVVEKSRLKEFEKKKK
jgi:hypothetical protein